LRDVVRPPAWQQARTLAPRNAHLHGATPGRYSVCSKHMFSPPLRWGGSHMPDNLAAYQAPGQPHLPHPMYLSVDEQDRLDIRHGLPLVWCHGPYTLPSTTRMTFISLYFTTALPTLGFMDVSPGCFLVPKTLPTNFTILGKRLPDTDETPHSAPPPPPPFNGHDTG